MLYHQCYCQVKPDACDDEGAQKKIVSEVFLTRLLSTKVHRLPNSSPNSLPSLPLAYPPTLRGQAFHAMFAIPQDKPLPKAIKTLFDFLDLQAADMNITDPEVLHTWKQQVTITCILNIFILFVLPPKSCVGCLKTVRLRVGGVL